MKRDLYFRIARENTPKCLRFVHVKDDLRFDRYRGLAHVDDEDEYGDCLWFESPTPRTLGRLFIFLHECSHIRRRHRPTAETYTKCEAEANLDTLGIFDREGIRVPLRVLIDQRGVFLRHVFQSDLEGYKRHPAVTRCLNGFDKHIGRHGRWKGGPCTHDSGHVVKRARIDPGASECNREGLFAAFGPQTWVTTG